MPVDTDEEVFEVVDEYNRTIGRQLRGKCHTEGLYHRAVYCFVFDTEGDLLLQQRADRKKIGPGEWDLSLAEHLQPGERYVEAVVRGLKEELGISIIQSDLQGPLSPFHKRILEIPGVVKDVEFVEAYRLDNWKGELQTDPDEVQKVRWVPLEKLYQEVEDQPEVFTAWLRGELGMLKDILLGKRKAQPLVEQAR